MLSRHGRILNSIVVVVQHVGAICVDLLDGALVPARARPWPEAVDAQAFGQGRHLQIDEDGAQLLSADLVQLRVCLLGAEWLEDEEEEGWEERGESVSERSVTKASSGSGESERRRVG